VRVFYCDQFVPLPLQVPSAEPTVPEKAHDLFSHIPAVHDERVGYGDHHEVCCPLEPGPVNADFTIVWPWNKPRAQRAADVGQTGKVNRGVYTKPSKAQIDALVDAENYTSLATTCTSSVTDMGNMFKNTTWFNGRITSWDVSSVRRMGSMFDGATAFHQDLSSCCVPLITSSRPFLDDSPTS
jgi:hypothetical protein